MLPGAHEPSQPLTCFPGAHERSQALTSAPRRSRVRPVLGSGAGPSAHACLKALRARGRHSVDQEIDEKTLRSHAACGVKRGQAHESIRDVCGDSWAAWAAVRSQAAALLTSTWLSPCRTPNEVRPARTSALVSARQRPASAHQRSSAAWEHSSALFSGMGVLVSASQRSHRAQLIKRVSAGRPA